jgi:adenine deaminase
MSLSFLSLSVIPQLKITDRGLIDVDAFKLVALEVDGGILAGDAIEETTHG